MNYFLNLTDAEAKKVSIAFGKNPHWRYACLYYNGVVSGGSDWHEPPEWTKMFLGHPLIIDRNMFTNEEAKKERNQKNYKEPGPMQPVSESSIHDKP